MSLLDDITPTRETYEAIARAVAEGRFDPETIGAEGWAEQAFADFAQVAEAELPGISAELIEELYAALERAEDPLAAQEALSAAVEAYNLAASEAPSRAEALAAAQAFADTARERLAPEDTATPPLLAAAEGFVAEVRDGEEIEGRVDQALVEAMSRRLAEAKIANIALGGALSTQIADLEAAIDAAARGLPIPPGTLEVAFANIAQAVHNAQTGGGSGKNAEESRAMAQAVEDMVVMERYSLTLEQAQYVATLETEQLRGAAAEFINRGYDAPEVVGIIDSSTNYLTLGLGIEEPAAQNITIMTLESQLALADASPAVRITYAFSRLSSPEDRDRFIALQGEAAELQAAISGDYPGAEETFDLWASQGTSRHPGHVALMERLRNGEITVDQFNAEARSLHEATDPFIASMQEQLLSSSPELARSLEAIHGGSLDGVRLFDVMPAHEAYALLAETYGSEERTRDEMQAIYDALPPELQVRVDAATAVAALDGTITAINMGATRAMDMERERAMEMERERAAAAGEEPNFENIEPDYTRVLEEYIEDIELWADPNTPQSLRNEIAARQGLTEEQAADLQTLVDLQGGRFDAEAALGMTSAHLSTQGINIDAEAVRASYAETVQHREAMRFFRSMDPASLETADEQTRAEAARQLQIINNMGDHRYSAHYAPLEMERFNAIFSPEGDIVLSDEALAAEEARVAEVMEEQALAVADRDAANYAQFMANPSLYGPGSDVFEGAVEHVTAQRAAERGATGALEMQVWEEVHAEMAEQQQAAIYEDPIMRAAQGAANAGVTVSEPTAPAAAGGVEGAVAAAAPVAEVEVTEATTAPSGPPPPVAPLPANDPALTGPS